MKLIAKALVCSALDNQFKLNQKLHADWHRQGWPFYRAVWTELAEAIMHTNWAWWKSNTYGKPLTADQQAEIHIELCDILHFGLSMDVVAVDGDEERVAVRADAYVDAFMDAARVKCDLTEDLEGCVVDAIILREFNVKKFARACKASGLDLDGLLLYYFAKTELNKFRWENGYKEKTYRKMWRVDGTEMEDNTFLIRIVRALRSTWDSAQVLEYLKSAEAQASIQQQLSAEYANQLKLVA